MIVGTNLYMQQPPTTHTVIKITLQCRGDSKLHFLISSADFTDIFVHLDVPVAPVAASKLLLRGGSAGREGALSSLKQTQTWFVSCLILSLRLYTHETKIQLVFRLVMGAFAEIFQPRCCIFNRHLILISCQTLCYTPYLWCVA